MARRVTIKKVEVEFLSGSDSPAFRDHLNYVVGRKAQESGLGGSIRFSWTFIHYNAAHNAFNKLMNDKGIHRISLIVHKDPV